MAKEGGNRNINNDIKYMWSNDNYSIDAMSYILGVKKRTLYNRIWRLKKRGIISYFR